MSKIASHKLVDGDIQKKPRSNAHIGSRKIPKKSMKNNVTSKMKTRRSEVVAADDSEGEDEGDSSATEEHDDTPEDPDVFALPSVQCQSGGETRKRLAGRDSKLPDMFHEVGMSDDAQAIEGADEDDSEGSEDAEEDYEGLDDISDEEESVNDLDERNLLLSAEEDLIEEYERRADRQSTVTMIGDLDFMVLDDEQALAKCLAINESDNSQTDDLGFPIPISMNEDPFHGFLIDEAGYRNLWDEAETTLFPAMARSRESSDPASATQKRVRFEEVQVDTSSGSESDDPNDAFPDLLDATEVATLERNLTFSIPGDGLDRCGINDAESFYDFEDEDERRAFEIDEESDSDEDFSSSDSDDDGDTTDDESPEEQIARMKAHKLAMSASGNNGDNEHQTPKPATHNAARTPPAPSTPRPTTPKSSQALKLGKFALDPTRATITTDSDGKKIKLLPPTTPLEKDKAFWDRAKTANSSRDGSPGSSYLTVATTTTEVIPNRPFTTELTLGSMFQGNLDILRNNDVNGIAEEMFPAMLNTQSSFATSATMDDSDTDTGDVNMQDFVDFDDCDSDTDGLPSRPLTSSDEPDLFDVYMPDGLNGRHGSDLMGHFDQNRSALGSFRRNQNQVRHVSSLASHPAKRASAHEYNALQKGRRGAANTPMTPARKKRVSQDLSLNGAGVRKNISSPLTARRPRSRGNSLVGLAANYDLHQTLGTNPFDQA